MSGGQLDVMRAALAQAQRYQFDISARAPVTLPVVRPDADAMPPSTGSARYDAGIATQGGVTSSPATTGAALDNALAGMVADVRGRASSFPEVPVPGMPTNSETQTVIVRDSAGGSKAVLIGTLFCVAAAGVTLYRAAKKKKDHA